MLDPFAQPSLATARRSRATVDPFQYARTDASRLPRPATTSRRKTPQEIEAEAYEDERKRLESDANDRQKQEQAAAKAALKAQNDAAEAAFRKEGRPFFTNASGQILPTQDDQTYVAEKQRKAANDQKASEYFQLSRPFRYDAQGNVVPRHTDEEWDAQKKAKAAELEAAKIDKANKDYRNQVRGGIDQQQAVLSSNDDMIQRRTQELQLAAENARAEVSKRKRFIEDAKKRLDEMDPADTQFDSVAAAAEKMQAELDEYQAQADAADEESRRQQAAKLSFDKDQDVLKGRLRQEEVGVDSLTAPTTSAQPVTGITPVGSMPTPRPPATATPGVRDQVLAGRVDAIAKDATLDDAARKSALTQLQLRRKDPAAYQTAVKLEFEQADVETLKPKLEQQMQAHEQRLADLQARTQAFTQKRDQVMNGVQVAFQRAQQRLAGPHTAGDLVTVPSPDGEKEISMPRDVAEGYMMSLARAKQWQDANQAEADLLEIESDEANLDAQLLNEGVRVLNAKRQAGVQRQAAERQQHLADLAASGHETQVRKIQGLDQEAEARLADIEEMYPENSPEREAAVKAIEQDIASKKQGVGQEIGEQAQKAARLYQDWGRGFAGNWITGETPEVDDESRTGAVMDENVQAVLKAKAKELGMSEKDLRHHLETQRLMDWSTPSTSASNAQQSGVAHELAKKLDLIGVAEPTRTLPSGDIMPNPELGQSQAKFDEAIDSAIGTQEAKDKAKALWPQYREMWLESARATLETSETLPGVESYQDWRDKNNAHLAGMSENQKAELYIEKMEKRGVFRKFLDNVSANLMAGSHDILTAIYGTGAVLTGAVEKATGAGTFTSQLLSEQAAEKSQQAQKLTQAQGIEGISGLGQGIVGQSARMAPGAIATMATGTMTGAMVAGAMQTGGMTYADAYHSLIEDGNSHADAWSQAAPASIAAGAMTAVLTKAFPGGVTALNNAANRSALQQGIQQAIRTFAASATSMGKAAVKGFADEVPQEILDEAFSQFAQGQAQGRAPREVVSEFLTGLPELIGAAGLMGAGGEIMGSRQSQTPPAGASDAMAETPSPAPSLVGAAPSSEPEAAPPVAASVGAADGGAAPEKWAAAEAALANFSQTTTLPAEVADKTAQKAQVLLKIAQGAKADSLDNDDLHLVGLHRDDAGKITQGYMSKNGWKKGPNPNGSPQPVEVLNGEFIITQRQIERLRNKEVGLGALADAIALPAEERRAQILAKEQPSTNTDETAPQPGPAASPAVDAAQGGAQEVAQAGDAPARGGQAVDAPAAAELTPHQMSPQAFKALRKTKEGASHSPAVTEFEHKGRIQQAIKEGKPVSKAAVEYYGIKIPSGMPVLLIDDLSPSAAPDEDAIPMAWPKAAAAEGSAALPVEQAVHPVLAQAGFDEPALERAGLIAAHLQDAGLSADEAAVAAGSVVKRMGVVGDDYTAQMVEDGFGQAMKEAGFQRVPHKPTRWERKPSTARPVMTEAEKVPGSKSQVSSQGAKSTQRRELSSRQDWRVAREAGLQAELRKLTTSKRSRAENQEHLRKLTTADKVLVDLVDNRFGVLFDDVIIGTTPAGLAAKVLDTDANGRATRVALVLDPVNFFAYGGLAPAEIERALDEEVQHRVDLMVSSRQEAIDLARAVHESRRNVFDRVWKDYYAIEIQNGTRPPAPPARLEDDDAYTLYFEATRMIHQGLFTTETVQDVGKLRQFYRYLKSWLVHVRRELAKLPRELKGEWMMRIETAEKLLKKIEKQAVAAEKAALEDIEPPDSAVKKPKKTPAANDPDLDDELDAAWEAEQKARRKAPTFTPAQQALRGLRKLPDPDNGQVNILSRIAMEGGIAIYSDKVRKLRKQQGKPVGGELDWLERADIPPFWKGIVFRRGNQQNVDTIIGQLYGEGYFPEAAEQADVTGEMLAAKIQDVLARYTAQKKGQVDVADADEQYGAEMSKLERQRVEFERSTESGPLKVRPADLKPGDVMQVKGDDGQLHPVEVMRLETRPLKAGEDYDPQGNPGHRLGPDGPEVIESVTLKDGTTFGVQTIDGQEGLFVDEFSVKDGADFDERLREAVMSRKLDDADALLHFMDHYGLSADTPLGEIVRQVQTRLKMPMKKAQQMLAAVFDTSAQGEGRAALDDASPLGSARKRGAGGPTLFGEDFDLFAGDKVNRGLLEQAAGTPAAAAEMVSNDTKLPDHQIPRFWIDAQGNVRKAKKIFQVEAGRGTSKLEFRKKPTHDVLFTGTRGEAEQWIQKQGGILISADDTTPAPAADFTLETVTAKQLDDEMEKAARKAKLTARQSAPLQGTAGEYGTPDMLDITAGPMALFSQPVPQKGTLFAAPKRALMQVEQNAASELPPARPDLDDFLPPKAERKTSGKVTTALKQWHEALKQWKTQFGQWASQQGRLGAFLAQPVKSAFGPMYQRANVVTPMNGGQGWRVTVFGRYEPDGITPMSGDWADGAWVPIGHHEFESQGEAYEDAISGMAGAEFTRRALFAAAKRVADTGSLFGEDQMMFLGDKNTLGLFEQKAKPSPSPSPAFTLESPTGAELDAEARRKKLREELQARQDKPLIGTQGDIGQMDMLGGNDLLSAPPAKKAEAPTPEPRIGDFGEKIGGARKDYAVKGEKQAKTGVVESQDPGWRKRYAVAEIVSGAEKGRWSIIDTRKKDWTGSAVHATRTTFATEQEAEDHIPLVAVARQHGVYSAGGATQDTLRYGIFRNVTDRKRVQVVKETFPTREDALKYMLLHAEEIIETKTSFGEEILVKPERAMRQGAERRTRDADAAMFQEAFGFRGVEFGNWMRDGGTDSERQEVLNHAYDGLHDLAEVLGIPPKAISLNGELALAFGARGHGLTGAKAHYERDYAVINLTKMAGAGSLAHEWFHALDHYLGRQDGKAARTRKPNKEGNLVYDARGRDNDYVSHGFGYKSEVREELRPKWKELMDRLFTKAEQFVEDTQKAEKFVGDARGHVVDYLAALRKDLAAQKDPQYYKRNNKPATPEQLETFDTLSAKIIEGEDLASEYRYNQPGDKPANARGALTGRWSNDTLDALSAIYKAVRGRAGMNSEQNGPLDTLQQYMKRYKQRIDMLASATAQESKTKMVPTEYAMDAKRIDQGRASDYWTTEHEMAARAFSAYIEDKVKAAGGSSQFLSYGSDNRFYRLLGMRPFPEGKERETINKLFDDFFQEVKVKETEQGMMLYSAAKRSFTANLSDSLKASAEVLRPVPGFKSQVSSSEQPATLNLKPGTDLRRFIDAATRGLSTAYAPLERVFLAAKSVNKNLTEREFGRMISAADEAGQVVLEPAESPATVEKANVFGVRMAGGVPAWGVAWNPEMTGIEQAASGWSMVDTDAESSGNAAADVLRFEDVPDADLSDKQRDNLRALEALWRQDAGAGGQTSPLTYRRIQAATDAAGRSLVQFTRHFEDATGKKFEWVESDPALPLPWRAAVSPQRSNTIFVHARAPGNVLALIGHEWGHTLENQNPVLYRALQKQLAAYVTRKDYKTARAGLKDRYRRAIIRTELTNNVIGDFFTDAAFWREVEQQDRGLLRQALQSVMDWFRDMAAKLGSLWGTEQVLTDVAAARQAVAAAFAAAVRQGPYSELSASDDADLVKTIDQAAHEAATSPRNDLPEPTPAQKEAGNYAKGHVRIGGHEISIENPAGSKRQPSWPALKDHYGYFKGTNAKDGDHVDVFVKPGTPEDYAGPVHVVRQNKVERMDLPKKRKEGEKGFESESGSDFSTFSSLSANSRFLPTKQFDEYKVMLGYPTAEEARAAYLRNYEPGWPGLERMTTHSAAEFARIKDQVFTVPADRVPGVRESDQVLASGAKRGKDGGMADPDKAAQNAEPSPGGLSEAEVIYSNARTLEEKKTVVLLFGLYPRIPKADAEKVLKKIAPTVKDTSYFTGYKSAATLGGINFPTGYDVQKAVWQHIQEIAKERGQTTSSIADRWEQSRSIKVSDSVESTLKKSTFILRQGDQKEERDMLKSLFLKISPEQAESFLDILNQESWVFAHRNDEDGFVYNGGESMLERGFPDFLLFPTDASIDDAGMMQFVDDSIEGGYETNRTKAKQRWYDTPKYVLSEESQELLAEIAESDGGPFSVQARNLADKYQLTPEQQRQLVEARSMVAFDSLKKDLIANADVVPTKKVDSMAELRSQVEASYPSMPPEHVDAAVTQAWKRNQGDYSFLEGNDFNIANAVVRPYARHNFTSYDSIIRKSGGKGDARADTFDDVESLLTKWSTPSFDSSRAAGGTLSSAAKRGPVEKVASAVFSKAPVAVASGLAKAGAAVVEKAGLQQVLAKMGSNNLDKFISKVVFGKAARWAGVDTAKKAVEVWLGRPGLLSRLAKGTLDQTVPLWNVPREWLAAYHESQRKAAWGREKAMDVIRALSHNAKVSDMAYPQEFVEDPAWRVKLFDAMEGKADMTTLPQPLQDLAARLRKLLKETGQELVRQGIMSLDTFEELSATGWMPRYTEEEAEAAGGQFVKQFMLGVKELFPQRTTAWHVVDTTRKQKDGQYAIVSRDEAGKRNRWRFGNEQHRNAWYEDFIKGEAVKMLTGGGKDVTSLLAALDNDATRAVRDEIKNLTREKIDRPAELSENLRHVVRRAVELQRMRYKKEAPFEPDKLIKDPVYSVARYVMGATHNAATMELLKVTAKNKEWVSDVALAGFKKMPDNDRFGPLAGKHVRDEIATQVLDLVDVPGAVGAFYDSVLRTWKAGKLVLNPGSHIRDAVGNIFFGVLAGTNPFNPGNLPYYRDAIAALRDGGDTYAELIEMQVLGGDALTNEVKTALKGLLPDAKTVDGKPAGWIMRRIMDVAATARGSYEYAAAVRQIPDNLYKTAAYLKYKAQGMSPAEAAAEVRKWFPYYDRLGGSTFHRKVVGRFINPFASFFRESTRILGRAAVERPLALSSIMAFAYGVTQYSLMMLGLGDDDEESVYRTMRGKLKFDLSGGVPIFAMLLPWRDGRGGLQQVDISSVLPFADLLGTRVEHKENEDEWTKFWRGMVASGPVLSIGLSWLTGQDSFTDRLITSGDMTSTEKTWERVKHAAEVMLPPLTPGLGVHYKTLQNAGRRTMTMDTRNATQSYLRALVGIDVRSADPNLFIEREHFRKLKNLPLSNDNNTFDSPLHSRLGRTIKEEMIQDLPSLDKLADAMLELERLGRPLKTRADFEKLLNKLDPEKKIKENYRRELVRNYSPEALRVYRNQVSEFKRSMARLPAVMKEASPLVKARRARVAAP